MPLPNRMLLGKPMPALNDVEGEVLPAGLPPVVDAHVHVFPEKLFQAVQAWSAQICREAAGQPVTFTPLSCAEKELPFLKRDRTFPTNAWKNS